MGLTISKLFSGLWSAGEEVRVVMVGLDAAGKTTIMGRMRLGEVLQTTPTVGFSVETLEYKNLKFNVWDIGGQDSFRRLWHHYYEGCKAVIFVIDSNDSNRFDQAKEELHNILNEPCLQGAAVLVFANKQDLPKAMSLSQITEGLNLGKNRKWYIQPSSATKGEGLYEGFDWLVNNIPRSS
eukprot:TRINITY_DN20104_c0_g1_i1.p1 TRINITY_DN20104_c0_g1~~TRINITY_DN20104_c0_g1_i1.p1  ORF type:complete len:181 (+),score=34.67 TRINITY_DN20104_c0_g1_i1:62-604(+)